MKDVSAKEKASTALKKHNWESYNLFGPLLKRSEKQRRSSSRDKVTDHEPQNDYSSNETSTVVVRVSECGFSDVDQVTPPKNISVVTEVDRRELSPDLDELIQSSEQQSAVSIKDEKARSRNNVKRKTLGRSLSEIYLTGSEDVRKTLECDLGNTSSHLSSLIREFPLTNNAELVPSLVQSLTHLESSKILSGLPSVTTILQKTLPPESVLALEKWKQRMVDQLGIEGFQLYQEGDRICIQSYFG